MSFAVLIFVVVVTLGACSDAAGEVIGAPGDPDAVDRVITLDATNELEFDPSSIEVTAGETIEFQVNNVAEVEHELVLGPEHEHHEGMDHSDGSAGTGAIKPGSSASLVWEFPEAGEVRFACYIANHNEAGMTGTITVSE